MAIYNLAKIVENAERPFFKRKELRIIIAECIVNINEPINLLLEKIYPNYAFSVSRNDEQSMAVNVFVHMFELLNYNNWY